MKFKLVFTLLVLAGAVLITSCAKKNFNKAEDALNDATEADAVFSAMFNSAASETQDAENQELSSNKTYKTLTDTCADISWEFSDDSTYLKSVTIDYGDGCDYNDRTFVGKLFLEMDGKFFEKGSSITITPGDDFSVDDYTVSGTKVITNQGFSGNLLSNFSWTFDVSVSGGEVTTPEGETIAWETERTQAWNVIWGDGIYLRVDGNINGTNKEGVGYDLTTEETMVWKAGCKHAIEGILKINTDNLRKEATVDFGDGTCDTDATLTYNGKDKEIVLGQQAS